MDLQWMQNFLGFSQCAAQSSSYGPANRPLINEDLEGENDALFYEFSCPFCYVEYDIGSLCSHLEEDHCSETRSVVCPVCGVKAGSNVVGHIMLQHAELFKRRKRPTKPANSSTSTSMPFSLEPLISSILSSLTAPESETIQASKEVPSSIELRSASLGGLMPEEAFEEAATRAKFVQQMVISTVFRMV